MEQGDQESKRRKKGKTQENERIEKTEPPCVTIPPASTLPLMQCSAVR